MKLSRALVAAAFLAVLPLMASKLKRSPAYSYSPPPEDIPQAAPCLHVAPVEEPQFGSEPGGTLVVLALIGIVIGVFTLIAAFTFPPAFVAAALVFGPVSLLGLAVLYVHFRAHEG